jgi:hypothetical protein
MLHCKGKRIGTLGPLIVASVTVDLVRTDGVTGRGMWPESYGHFGGSLQLMPSRYGVGFFRNVCEFLPDYATLHLRRQYLLYEVHGVILSMKILINHVIFLITVCQSHWDLPKQVACIMGVNAPAASFYVSFVFICPVSATSSWPCPASVITAMFPETDWLDERRGV